MLGVSGMRRENIEGIAMVDLMVSAVANFKRSSQRLNLQDW